MKRWPWFGVLLVVALVVALVTAGIVVGVAGRGGGGKAVAPVAPVAPVALPSSMAAVGDSITRAFDIDSDHVLQDTPSESWSTGSDALLGSQFDRILAAQPAIAGRAFNDAESGAKLSALDRQLAQAASQGVDYVTVLMGANDLCTPTVATMTSTATVRNEFSRALADFVTADPSAHVFVASIPDLIQLWNTERANPLAEVVWSLAHICPSVLSQTATPADRDAVVARERADNGILQSVCAQYPHCRFDGFAVNHAGVAARDVSTVDYFHPSPAGQQSLAAITWAAGYWPAAP